MGNHAGRAEEPEPGLKTLLYISVFVFHTSALIIFHSFVFDLDLTYFPPKKYSRYIFSLLVVSSVDKSFFFFSSSYCVCAISGADYTASQDIGIMLTV